jgi:hypothetical protein
VAARSRKKKKHVHQLLGNGVVDEMREILLASPEADFVFEQSSIDMLSEACTKKKYCKYKKQQIGRRKNCEQRVSIFVF